MNSKSCLKRPLKRRPKIGFQVRLSLNAGQKYCRMLQGRAFCKYFCPALSDNQSLRLLFCLFLSGCLRQVLLSFKPWPSGEYHHVQVTWYSCFTYQQVTGMLISTLHLQAMWAVTCDFQQCGVLTCVDSDEPVQPLFKLRSSKWSSVSSLTVIEYSRD